MPRSSPDPARRRRWPTIAVAGAAAMLALTSCAGAAPAGPESSGTGIAFSASPEPVVSSTPSSPASTASPPAHRSPGPKPTLSPTPTPVRRIACPRNPLRGVYHPDRLTVLGTCRWFRGTVTSTRYEEDGDYHVDVAPAAGFGRFLDQDNELYQHGSLVTEIMPGQSLPVPSVGERVAVLGTWVYDSDHGWNEIHPIWAIRYVATGVLVRRLPPKTPRYQPGEGGSGGGSGGSGGGGNCDPAYPTVCIPPPPPDLDCADVPYRDLKVLPPDPHGFDGDGDGIGCES